MVTQPQESAVACGVQGGCMFKYIRQAYNTLFRNGSKELDDTIVRCCHDMLVNAQCGLSISNTRKIHACMTEIARHYSDVSVQ
jgi:hypothetical protein